MDQKQLQAFATVRESEKHLILVSERKSFLENSMHEKGKRKRNSMR